MSCRRRHLLAIGALSTFATALPGHARAAGADVDVDVDEADLSLHGYDPVAYVTLARASEGDPRFAVSHAGAIYRFVDQANLEAFQADPERYLPRYGGYCAYAAANGYKANGDPEVWKIVDGRLYLNYSPAIGRRWEADQAGMIARADRNWPEIASVPADRLD